MVAKWAAPKIFEGGRRSNLCGRRFDENFRYVHALGEASRLQSLFAQAGFVDIETHTEKHTFELPSFDAYYSPFERGGASTGQELAARPNELTHAKLERSLVHGAGRKGRGDATLWWR